jgi:Asp-tRNA(Asn)/Glu-tRNA(Gln) amidotransferase A subunit family amidase
MTAPWTVQTLTAALAKGEISAEAVAEQSLARIAAEDGRLRAVITPNPDVLTDARRIDARRAAGQAVGRLAGVPVLVKDTMDMAGLPTTGGWSLFSARAGGTDLVPTRDSAVVARMRRAGALLLGKTNVPVMSASGTNANDRWAGPTLNAIAPDRAPGGSSAGSATGVAAGYAVIGLAEETGGSIQNPAAAQGLVGIKPTFALVPN